MYSNRSLITKTARVIHDSIYVRLRPPKVVSDGFIHDILTKGAPKPNGVADGLFPIVDLYGSPFHFHGYDTEFVTDATK